MKKTIIYFLFTFGLFGTELKAQNYFERLEERAKAKVNQRVDRKTDAEMDKGLDKVEQGAKSKKTSDKKTESIGSQISVNTTGNEKDGAKYGKVIMQITQKDKDESTESYNLYVASCKVVNNSLKMKIVYAGDMYDYENGKVKKSGEPLLQYHNPENNFGSEKERMSVDITSQDIESGMKDKNKGISSGYAAGQAFQTYTFKGNMFTKYMMGKLVKNMDSSVVGVAGMGEDKKYSAKSSNGLKLELPSYPTFLFLSENGNYMAGAVLGSPTKIYLSNGKSYPIEKDADVFWLHNSGNIFSIGHEEFKTLKKNDKVILNFDYPMNPDLLFISNDGERSAWINQYGCAELRFSDGNLFKNTYTSHRVTIDKKEYIVFLYVKDRDIYLVQYPL